MEAVGLKRGLALSPANGFLSRIPKLLSSCSELRDYTCGYGNFAGKQVLRLRRLLNTIVFPENAGCELPVTGDICWVSGL